MTIALLVLAWLAFGAGFIAGCVFATRPAEPKPPVPQFRRVARPSIVARVNHPDADYIAISADYVAQRADFDPSARAALDSLVLLDSLLRNKW